MTHDILTPSISIVVQSLLFRWKSANIIEELNSNILEMCMHLKDWLDTEEKNQELANNLKQENSPEDN